MAFICPEKWRAVARAFAEGKVIQIKAEVWRDCQIAPYFCEDQEYRVKPERRHKWVVRHKNGDMRVTQAFYTEEELMRLCATDGNFLPVQRIDSIFKDD